MLTGTVRAHEELNLKLNLRVNAVRMRRLHERRAV